MSKPYILCLLLPLNETAISKFVFVGSYYDALALRLRSSTKRKNAEVAASPPSSSRLDVGRGRAAVTQGMGSAATAAALAISKRIMGEERGEGGGYEGKITLM